MEKHSLFSSRGQNAKNNKRREVKYKNKIKDMSCVPKGVQEWYETLERTYANET